MITEIGICAGQVLLCLEAHCGQMSIENLFRELDVPSEVLFMALGWLARESYVHLHGRDLSEVVVSLRWRPGTKNANNP